MRARCVFSLLMFLLLLPFSLAMAAPATPTNLRSLEQTLTPDGTIRMGWDHTQSDDVATGFKVYRQHGCTGDFVPLTTTPMPYQFEMGVNEPTPAFGVALPGTYGVDYYYPVDPAIDPSYTGHLYLEGKGLRTVRLAIKWERIQHTLGGALDATELARLVENVPEYTSRGNRVILDIHNFARYNIGGTLHVIGDADGVVTIEHFADLWTRLADEFKTDLLVDFNLVNQPHTMPTETVVAFSNAAIAAIRATGATNRILVDGNHFAHPVTWNDSFYGTPNATAMLNIVDSGNNTVFAVHEYFDDLTPPPNVGEGECVSPTIGTERLAPFTAWLREHNKKGYLAEFGSIASPTCLTVIVDVMNHLRANSDIYHGWLWWAIGPWWPAEFPMDLEPDAEGNDQPQMDAMEPFLAENAAVAQTYTNALLTPGQSYCWQVTAVNAAGVESAPSNTLQWNVGGPMKRRRTGP